MATVLLVGLGLVIVVVLLNLPIGGGGASPSGGGSGVIIGSPLLDKAAPEFQLATLDGRQVRLSDYRGRPVIVNFWASWCIPCRDEFPLFVRARGEHAGDGLEILGIVHEDSSDAATAFARQMGAGWPLLLDPDQVAWKAYQGIGVPSTYLIDRQGIVRATSLGPVLSSALPGQLARIL